MARNPLRSEAEAFRLVIATLIYFTLIAVAAAIATWLGLIVFVALSGLVLWRWTRKDPVEP